MTVRSNDRRQLRPASHRSHQKPVHPDRGTSDDWDSTPSPSIPPSIPRGPLCCHDPRRPGRGGEVGVEVRGVSLGRGIPGPGVEETQRTSGQGRPPTVSGAERYEGRRGERKWWDKE